MKGVVVRPGYLVITAAHKQKVQVGQGGTHELPFNITTEFLCKDHTAGHAHMCSRAMVRAVLVLCTSAPFGLPGASEC